MAIEEESITPISENEEISFSESIDEGADLSSVVIDNIYINVDSKNGDGYDASEQALVLKSTTTTEQMDAIQDAIVGDAVIRENFNGIIFEVSAGQGTITVDAKTVGSHVLNVQIGNAAPTKITKTERGTVEVPYNVTEPTYVYLYASTEDSDAARIYGAPSVDTNSVLLYGYKVTVGGTGISLIPLNKTVDVYDLQGNKVRSNAASLEGLAKGIYIIHGRKVVVK